MKEILITGATGFVGQALMRFYPEAKTTPSLRKMTQEQIMQVVGNSDTKVVIHTAAVSDIGACQRDPEESYYANVLLPEYIARACVRYGKKLIAFSSDQVYSGNTEPGPYTEEMICPGNLYAEQKLEMENRVLDIEPEAVLLRAEWMYDFISSKGNYFLNVLRAETPLHFSKTQFRGITYVREVAVAMEEVMRLPGGIYNFGSETDKSIYEITEEFLRLTDIRVPLMSDGKGHNLWMDCEKAKKGNVFFSNVSDALKICWNDYQNAKKV